MTIQGTRILSFLGTTDYDPVVYQRPDTGARCKKGHKFVVHSIVELYEGPHHVAVFLTTEARKRNLNRLEIERSTVSAGDATFATVDVDNGKDVDELRGIFERVREYLTSRPKVELGEVEPPKSIILDVTHGFRVQPLIAMAAVAELESRWRRERTAGQAVPELHILYGGYDPHNCDHLPEAEELGTWTKEWMSGGKVNRETRPYRVADLWEMGEFTLQSRLSQAVDALLRFGRGDDLERTLVELARGHSQEKAARPWLEEASRRIREFSDALCLAQAPELVRTHAPALLDHLRDAPTVVRSFPVFEDARTALIEELQDIACSGSTVAPGSMPAYKALAKWYLDLQRFAECMSLIAEAEGVWAAAVLGETIPAEPGHDGFKAGWSRQRNWIEKAKAHLASKADNSAKEKSATGRDTRNAIAHAGFREDVPQPNEMRAAVRAAVERFSDLPDLTESVTGQDSSTFKTPVRLLFRVADDEQRRISEVSDQDLASVECTALSMYPKARTALDLCMKLERILSDVAGVPQEAFFGSASSIEDMPLAVQLQSQGVTCYQWRAKCEGHWIEMPSAKRLLGVE